MKRKALTGMALLLVVAFSTIAGCGASVSQQDYDKAKTDLDKAETDLDNAKTDLDKAKTDLDILSKIFSFEADSAKLRNSAQIKWAKALEAVQRFEREGYRDGATLAETAYERLDAFIADTEELVATEDELANQVPAEYANIYEQSARLDQARLKEASALKEEVQGRLLFYTMQREYDVAYRRYLNRETKELFTEQQKQAWLSSLNEAVTHYQTEIKLLNEATDIAPELTRYLDRKIEYAENYQREVSSIKDRIEQPTTVPAPAPAPVPVPVPAPGPPAPVPAPAPVPK